MGTNGSEKPEEIRVRALLAHQFSQAIDRVPTDTVTRADYRTRDDLHGFEIKRLTSQAYLQLGGASAEAKHLDSKLLAGRWHVMIERPDLSTRIRPLPPFPKDNPEQIAALEAEGLDVTPQAERIAEHREANPGTFQPPPKISGLCKELEPHLVVLEKHGYSSTRGLSPWGVQDELTTAVRAIAVLTQDGLCMRHEITGMTPGIDIALATGSIRTERADTVVERIDLWLSSADSENLRESLLNEGGRTRHAFLVFDAQTEPEYQAAVDQGVDFGPTLSLPLPAEVDILWFVLGAVLCRYAPDDGWSSFLVSES